MIPYLLLFQIFIVFISSSILFFVPGLFEYKQLVVGVNMISILMAFYELFRRKYNGGFIKSIIIYAVILVLCYNVTGLLYDYHSEWYYSYRLLVAGQTAPVLLTSAIVASNRLYQFRLEKIVPYLAILFTVVAIIVTLNPRTAAQGLAGDEDANLNYQSVSYLAAYGCSLALFYIYNFNKIAWGRILRIKISKWMFWGVVIVNLLTILLSGGRGGLITYLVLVSYFFYLSIQDGKKHILRPIFTITVLVLIGYYVLTIVENSSLETSGFHRILEFVNEGNTSGRENNYALAWNVFLDSPIIGHGVGGIFCTLGFYSHNVFLDIMIDTGVIGLIFFVVFIIKTIKKGLHLSRLDPHNTFWMFIFWDGFTMNLFSGCYLSGLLWISASVVIFYNYKNRSTI